MRRERRWPIPFLDLSNTLFFFFVALFALTLLVISDDSEAKKIDTTSRFLVSLKWADGSDSDIDLSLKTPAGEVVWFRTRQATFASLDQDNLGRGNRVVIDNDGNVVAAPQRDEVIYLRQTIGGVYVVNVHAYSLAALEKVTVTLVAIDPQWRQVVTRQLTLVERHQEETAFRFTIDAAGTITSTDYLSELFINDLLAGKPIQ